MVFVVDRTKQMAFCLPYEIRSDSITLFRQAVTKFAQPTIQSNATDAALRLGKSVRALQYEQREYFQNPYVVGAWWNFCGDKSRQKVFFHLLIIKWFLFSYYVWRKQRDGEMEMKRGWRMRLVRALIICPDPIHLLIPFFPTLLSLSCQRCGKSWSLILLCPSTTARGSTQLQPIDNIEFITHTNHHFNKEKIEENT